MSTSAFQGRRRQTQSVDAESFEPRSLALPVSRSRVEFCQRRNGEWRFPMRSVLLSGVVPASELQLRELAPGVSTTGSTASEFLELRLRNRAAFVSSSSPKNRLPALFEDSRRFARRIKSMRIGEQINTPVVSVACRVS